VFGIRAAPTRAHVPLCLMVLASSLVTFATDVIDAIGVIGVAFLIAIESVFPPIPSEVVLLLSGFLASDGRFHFAVALTAATIGSVVGAWVLYAVGAFVGEDRMESLLTKVGKPLGFRRKDIDRANEWFERHGSAVVFFGRLVPLVRSLVSLPAGADRMSPVRFTLLTLAGSLLWNTVWLSVGFALGDQWERAEAWSGWFDYVAYAAIAGTFVWIVLRRFRRRGELADVEDALDAASEAALTDPSSKR
jgi:membrane protein DedA with SNARE-associated domain